MTEEQPRVAEEPETYRASLAECVGIISAIVVGLLLLPGLMTLMGMWVGAAVTVVAVLALLGFVWWVTS